MDGGERFAHLSNSSKASHNKGSSFSEWPVRNFIRVAVILLFKGWFFKPITASIYPIPQSWWGNFRGGKAISHTGNEDFQCCSSEY